MRSWIINRRTVVPAALCAALILLPGTPARADQDDNVNNADLQPTVEEVARRAVLKRWPDALDLDVANLDEEDETNQDDDKANKADIVEKQTDGKGKDPKAIGEKNIKELELKDKIADADDEKDDDDAADAGEDGNHNWSISVLFVSNGSDFEALLDDSGKILCVHEDISIEKAPKKIVEAAQKAVAMPDGEILYVDKVSDESKTPVATSYCVGIGLKEVKVSAEGKVLKIVDVPDDEEDAPDGLDDDAPKGKEVI